MKQILEGANLEHITMKTVCKQVYNHFPDFDLAHKKDFIKATVKSVSSSDYTPTNINVKLTSFVTLSKAT